MEVEDPQPEEYMTTKPQITRFATASGSLYEIDHAAKTWRRLAHAPKSRFVRTPEGHFTSVSPIQVGAPVRLVCPPLLPGTDLRIIETTPVARILPPDGDA